MKGVLGTARWWHWLSTAATSAPQGPSRDAAFPGMERAAAWRGTIQCGTEEEEEEEERRRRRRGRGSWNKREEGVPVEGPLML